MRRLILVGLMAATGMAAAEDPFRVDPENIQRMAADRIKAQADWAAKTAATRTLATKDFEIQTHDLGLELRSWPHQRIEPFLVEQGPVLRTITQQTGWEVCARVCLSQDGHLGLRVQTLRAALACHAGNEAADCPSDMIPTPVVVHTHGEGSIVQTTRADGQMGHAGDFSWIENANLPSPEDLAADAGWLLAPNGSLVRYGQHPDWMLAP